MAEQNTKIMTIVQNNTKISVPIPLHLYPIIDSKRRAKPFYPNIILAPICNFCAVNMSKFYKEDVDYIKQKFCVSCDKKTPYILVSVTEVSSFESCEMTWYFANILNIPQTASTPMLEGIIAHTFDNILVKLMNDREFFGKLKDKYPSRFDMYNEVVKRLNEEYDVIIKNLLEEIKLMQGYVPERALQSLKRDIFDKLLEDFAYLAIMRLYNDILFGGDYRKLISRRWEEKKVFGGFEHNGVKLLITGKVDKLYRLGNNKFFIRDDKSLRTVRVPTRGQSLYSYSTQLGGYAFLLKQMHSPDVETIGCIWLLRFADIAPIECDVERFVSIAKKLCTFIAEGKAATRCVPHTGLCSPDYCSYWNSCWGLNGK